MFVTKKLMEPTDFHSIGKNTMEANRNHQLFGYTHSSKYLYFIQQKKEIHRGLKQLEGE